MNLTAGVGPPPWLVPGSLSDVPGPGKNTQKKGSLVCFDSVAA